MCCRWVNSGTITANASPPHRASTIECRPICVSLRSPVARDRYLKTRRLVGTPPFAPPHRRDPGLGMPWRPDRRRALRGASTAGPASLRKSRRRPPAMRERTSHGLTCSVCRIRPGSVWRQRLRSASLGARLRFPAPERTRRAGITTMQALFPSESTRVDRFANIRSL
jgi:hypothetical protein